MEPDEEKVRTDIDEEHAPSPDKAKKRVRLFIGLGAVLIVLAVAMLIVAVRPHRERPPDPTTDDLEQQKYDAAQGEQERQKAAGIRDDHFLVRKEDNSQSQLSALLKGLNIDKDPAANLPTPATDQQAKTEEEAIAHVLRNPTPPAVSPVRPSQPGPAAPTSQPEGVSDADMRPMFVSFRQACGHDSRTSSHPRKI